MRRLLHKCCVRCEMMDEDQPAPEEPEMETEETEQTEQETADGEEDLFSKLILYVMKSILRDEMVETVAAMDDFRTNLLQILSSKENEELLDKTLQIVGLHKAMKEGWKIWREGGADKERASYEAFKKHILPEEP